MQRWKLVWRPNVVFFGTKGMTGQMPLKNHHGYSRHQMTSWLYRTLLFPSSFLPIDWALFFLLIWSPTRSCRTDEDSHGRSLTVPNSEHQYSGSASPKVAVKLISVSSPWHFKSIYLHLWIRTWLKIKRLFKTLEIQIDPQQQLTHQIWSDISVHHSSRTIEIVSVGHCVHSGASHDIKPSHGIANIIQLTFQMRNPALCYHWIWSGAQWFRGGSSILWLSAPSLWQWELLDTYCIVGADRLSGWIVRGRHFASWKWIFVHRHLSTDLATVEN